MKLVRESAFDIIVIDSSDPNCCSDFDEDCELVVDKVCCQRHNPEKGICPYLGD